MALRDRTKLGIALAGAVLAGLASVWVAVLLLVLAVFLIVWGQEPKRTEAFVGRLPYGNYLLKALAQLDLILSPRDLKQEEHFRAILLGYGPLARQYLRQLRITGNPKSVLEGNWQQFFRDGLVEHLHSGPGGIRPELREMIGRLLVEFQDTT